MFSKHSIDIKTESQSHVGQLVIASGNPSSRLMLIGEAPGAKEEEIGFPFVGRSGMLLRSLLTSCSFDPNFDMYITNLVKSRPPKNRTPTKEEVSLQLPWLYQQIKVVDPIIIVLIGSSALHIILGKKFKISKTRGSWHNWNGIFVTPIYHPSYLLRNPSRLPGRPYDLTCLDLYEVKKKFSELVYISKKSATYIPIIE